MAIRKIARLGSPVLRSKAEVVPVDSIETPEVQSLIDDMLETKEDYSGVGLAAPQVHESLRIIAVGMDGQSRYSKDDDVPLTVMLNPKIVDFSEETDVDWEGCLSLTDLWGLVKRSVAITVEGYDRHAGKVEMQVEGFMARIFQHEIDHLYGKLFVDRMSDMRSLSFGKEQGRFARFLEGAPAGSKHCGG